MTANIEQSTFRSSTPDEGLPSLLPSPYLLEYELDETTVPMVPFLNLDFLRSSVSIYVRCGSRSEYFFSGFYNALGAYLGRHLSRLPV